MYRSSEVRGAVTVWTVTDGGEGCGSHPILGTTCDVIGSLLLKTGNLKHGPDIESMQIPPQQKRRVMIKPKMLSILHLTLSAVLEFLSRKKDGPVQAVRYPSSGRSE